MKFKLNIDVEMGNAAFEDSPEELHRILRDYVNETYFPHLFTWAERKPLHDHNGNRVGTATAEVSE